MINKNELDEFIQKITNTKLNQDNYKEFFDYSIKVCKDYDKNSGIKSDMRLNELIYIYLFYHKYCNMLYNQKVKAIIDPNSAAHNAYYWNEDTIKYSLSDFELMQNSTYLIFNIFHENRHAVQHTQKNVSDIMSVDPMKLLYEKEIMFTPKELYNKNHNTMLIENDANLVAYSYLLPIIRQYFPENLSTLEQRIKFEHENVATKLYNGFIDSNDIHKNPLDSDTLPVIYEIDKQFKEHIKNANITPEMLDEMPIYKYIIDENGQLKSYNRIIEDKKKLINSQSEIDKKMIVPISSANYDAKVERTPREQIDFIYKIIINSDPKLYIEDCIANKKYKELVEEIHKYPKIYELYKREFHNIISRYLNLNNKSDFDKINLEINSEDLKQIISKRYEYIIKSEIKNITGVTLSFEDENEKEKDVNVLQQEYEYFNTILKNKKSNKQINENIYNILNSYLNKMYNLHGVKTSHISESYLEKVEKLLNIKIDGIKGYKQVFIDNKEVYEAFPKNEKELIAEKDMIISKIQKLEDEGLINTSEKQKMIKSVEEKYVELFNISNKYYINSSNSSAINELEQDNNQINKQPNVDLIDNIPSEFNEIYNRYLKESYKQSKGFYEEGYMTEEEKKEFEQQLDNVINDLMISGEYKKDKDRKDLWKKIEPVIKENPNIDLDNLIYEAILGDTEKVEEPEEVEELEVVEKTGRKFK